MRHRRILNAAVFAAKVAADVTQPDADEMAPLYDYARRRGFPPPETLARKYGEIHGMQFPFASLEAAPESYRLFFAVFRSVALTLEPFHEDQGEVDHGDDDLGQADLVATLAVAATNADQPDDDQAAIGSTSPAPQTSGEEPDMAPISDGAVQERTATGQAAMDAETEKHRFDGGADAESEAGAESGETADKEEPKEKTKSKTTAKAKS